MKKNDVSLKTVKAVNRNVRSSPRKVNLLLFDMKICFEKLVHHFLLE